MAKKKKISMDEKAAKDGDRLKHPLCLEVIGGCATWDKVTSPLNMRDIGC